MSDGVLKMKTLVVALCSFIFVGGVIPKASLLAVKQSIERQQYKELLELAGLYYLPVWIQDAVLDISSSDITQLLKGE